MNTLLLKHKPKDTSNEDFIKTWNNSSYSLNVLYNVLLDIKENLNKFNKEDFDCPNHYAKLAFNNGQIKMIDQIVSMLPDSAKG